MARLPAPARLAVGLLAGAALSACGTSTVSTGPLRFAACDGAECARATVPLDWRCADGACDTPAVDLLVRRVRADPAQLSRRQLWALDGGPGFAGEGFLDPVFVALVTDAGYDLYVPTHRGTPGSDGLTCPDQQAPESEGGGLVTLAELAPCRAALEDRWGDLTPFNSVAAGRDVAHLMARAPPSDAVAVFGGSYGTLWAQRVLQATDAVDVAWLDSVVDLEGTLENADQHADLAARALFAQCAASGACPLTADEALAVLAAHDRNQGCTDASGAELRALGFRFLSGRIHDRVVYVTMLARAARCDAADRTALQHALTRARAPAAPPTGPPLPYAQLLNVHVVASELDGGAAPSPQASLLASPGRDAPVRARNDAWGRVPLSGPLETTSPTRVVLLSGTLDPLDPLAWAERTRARWDAEHIVVPSAGHSVMRYARTAAGNCLHGVFQRLLAAPTAPLDLTCLDDVEPIDWAIERASTEALLRDWFGD